MVVLGYLAYVNVRKVEFVENYCEAYVRLLSTLYFRVRNVKERMAEIDRLGAFRADDEVGYAFKEIDQLIEDLHTFMTRYVNAEATEEKTK